MIFASYAEKGFFDWVEIESITYGSPGHICPKTLKASLLRLDWKALQLILSLLQFNFKADVFA